MGGANPQQAKSAAYAGFPTKHPFVSNPDGSKSNVKLGTWGIDDRTYVIPTMVGGKQLSADEALKTARSYGFTNYPSFKTQAEADQWVQQYHGSIGEDGKPLTTQTKYPVLSAKETGLDEYFKKNPNVSGMAWGGGMNASPKDMPRSVVLNPYTTNLPTAQASNSVIRNEQIRHQMDEGKWKGNFAITPEQQTWAQSLGTYATNPEMLKQTIVARMAAGDFVPNPTTEQVNAASQFRDK